jgi:hypothetical protein
MLLLEDVVVDAGDSDVMVDVVVVEHATKKYRREQRGEKR